MEKTILSNIINSLIKNYYTNNLRLEFDTDFQVFKVSSRTDFELKISYIIDGDPVIGKYECWVSKEDTYLNYRDDFNCKRLFNFLEAIWFSSDYSRSYREGSIFSDLIG